MKYLLLLNLIFLSGCCAFTSKDCGCKPPKPELEEETLKWIAPYNNQAYFIFKDSIGNQDTLQIERKSDTEYCGGEECGADCQLEIGILSSRRNPGLKFTITAALMNVLRINSMEDTTHYMLVHTYLLNERIFPQNEGVSASLAPDYDWKNEKIKVLKVNCAGSPKCLDYEMREMIVSRDFGLIEYITKDGIRWKKAN